MSILMLYISTKTCLRDGYKKNKNARHSIEAHFCHYLQQSVPIFNNLSLYVTICHYLRQSVIDNLCLVYRLIFGFIGRFLAL